MNRSIHKIMVIEDDPHSIYLMERYTRSTHCQPVCANRAESALALAREEQPAVIFLDLMLPEFSGWEVLRTLKADPVTHPIPVFICSALNEAEQAHAAGVGYLPKPIYYQDFLTALKDAGIEPPFA